MSSLYTLKFYLAGGHVLLIKHVKDYSISHSDETGKILSYSLTYDKVENNKHIYIDLSSILAIEKC
jgi:hypothetical protein